MDKDQDWSESTEAPAIDSGTAKSSAQESDHELQPIKNYLGGSTIWSNQLLVVEQDEKANSCPAWQWLGSYVKNSFSSLKQLLKEQMDGLYLYA